MRDTNKLYEAFKQYNTDQNDHDSLNKIFEAMNIPRDRRKLYIENDATKQFHDYFPQLKKNCPRLIVNIHKTGEQYRLEIDHSMTFYLLQKEVVHYLIRYNNLLRIIKIMINGQGMLQLDNTSFVDSKNCIKYSKVIDFSK